MMIMIIIVIIDYPLAHLSFNQELDNHPHPQLHYVHNKGGPTVGFHNFNLRIFNLRVSKPNKLIVDVF